MPVTMKDIAKRAGVSIRTVSRVVNGQGEISAETATRVQAIIDELGYRPNQMARGLVSNRTNSLAFVIASLINPYYAELAQGISAASHAHNYQMLLSSHENNAQQQRSVFASLVAQGVDGIIVFPARESISDFLRFSDNFRPVIAIDIDVQHPNISLVGTNVYKGAQMAVEHLIERGHTHIGMVNAARSIKKTRERGFLDAMKQHNLMMSDDKIIPGDDEASDIIGGMNATKALLSNHPEITAIFCYNDLMGLGAIRAAQDLNLSIPDDLAIVGFDDIYIGNIFKPELTTIRVDKSEMGRVAVETLLSLLDNDALANQSIVLDPELIVRDTT